MCGPAGVRGGPPRQIVSHSRSGLAGRVSAWWEGLHRCRVPFGNLRWRRATPAWGVRKRPAGAGQAHDPVVRLTVTPLGARSARFCYRARFRGQTNSRAGVQFRCDRARSERHIPIEFGRGERMPVAVPHSLHRAGRSARPPNRLFASCRSSHSAVGVVEDHADSCCCEAGCDSDRGDGVASLECCGDGDVAFHDCLVDVAARGDDLVRVCAHLVEPHSAHATHQNTTALVIHRAGA